MHYTPRGSHTHRARRTICDRDQNEIKRSTSEFVLNQAIKERSKEAIKPAAHRRVRLTKTYMYRVSC